MDDMERRLAMIQQLKQEQAQNRERMYRRNRIVNGADYHYQTKNHSSYNTENISNKELNSSTLQFKSIYVRFGICIVLFLGFYYLKQNNTDFMGINASFINNVITEKVDINSFAFLQNIPYTLEE